MFAEVFQPVGAAPPDLALEAVAEVGAGGHFFGCAHTMERYRSAFYAPLVSDWRNFGSWSEDGGKTATERASGIWQGTLARYVAPKRDAAVLEALDAYVAKAYWNLEVDALPYLKMAASRGLGTYQFENVRTQIMKLA